MEDQKAILNSFTCHTGGAIGADNYWKHIGKENGVKVIDWRPHHLGSMTEEGKSQMLIDVKSAADVLKRPWNFKGNELVQRNWFIPHHSVAIYAIGKIVEPGEEDFKGFENKTGKQIVAGGTGWAVEMAIQKEKPVFVFCMKENKWMLWLQHAGYFSPINDIPILTQSFGGIGSRVIGSAGVKAIEDVYRKTREVEYEDT